MVFLEFEKPLEKLYEQLEKIREVEQGVKWMFLPPSKSWKTK